ncbi:C40 family peptidase [Methylocystis sp. SC2]|uniref:C40 family peptidase n=1 Tax=Methylocystis sp. (strain SC2) TaxID=187303 RepID=UPI00027AF0F8|nr:NlpC/P60 family protein [Methylocystis sp. SC2]CCJ07111.1 Phage tail assembly protein, NLP/P60 [Methylocystis sp. SC2]
MSHWSTAYIGLPFAHGGRTRDGLDCWGLVRLVYADQLGIELDPLDGYATRLERLRIAGMLSEQAAQGPWRRLAGEKIKPFDVVSFTIAGAASHVGVVVDWRDMLHVTEGETSGLAPHSEGQWARRLIAAYRHVDR